MHDQLPGAALPKPAPGLFWNPFLQIFLTVLLTAAAQILLKVGADSSAGDNSLFSWLGVHELGSGWTWLAKASNGSLTIENTSNAENPMTQGMKPLLTLDVWEHAYYLKYQNRRLEYIGAFWNVINWDFCEERFGHAK